MLSCAQDGPRCTLPASALGMVLGGRMFCYGHAHQPAALAGAQTVLAACRWVKDKERCLVNEAKIMKDVRLHLPHTVLWGFHI